MWFSKPKEPRVAAWSTVFGVVLGMFFTYGLVYAGELISGDHFLDFDLLRGLAIIGLAVLAFGWWENRDLKKIV